MLYIAVVDDEQTHRELLAEYIEQWKTKRKIEAAVTSFASSEQFFFEWCENEQYDILFLDIMMSGISGVELAKQLREKGLKSGSGKKVEIVFTTGLSEYMQEGYEVEALHYLLKPIDREKVWQCLDKCISQKETKKHLILLPTEDGMLKVDTESILYAEALGHSCMLVCEAQTLQVKMGIHELYQILGETGAFLFCHRSYLIQVRKIAKIQKSDVVMDNGAEVPLSRRMQKEVSQKFIAAFRR